MTLKKKAAKRAMVTGQLVAPPVGLGSLLESIRTSEEQSLATFAARLGIARGNLCDIEKGRRKVSLDRAAAWAKLLGHAEGQFVALALQDEVRAAGLKLKVSVRAARLTSRAGGRP